MMGMSSASTNGTELRLPFKKDFRRGRSRCVVSLFKLWSGAETSRWPRNNQRNQRARRAMPHTMSVASLSLAKAGSRSISGVAGPTGKKLAGG